MNYEQELFRIAPHVREVMIAASLIDSDISPKAFKLPRTGWGEKGIINGESIYIHSCKVGLASWYYLKSLNAVNEGIVHDMPEIITGDKLPWELPKEEKRRLETVAMHELSKLLPNGEFWLETWLAYEMQRTQTSPIVNQLDKMCLIVQAADYKRIHPDIDLSEFYENNRPKITNKDLGEVIDFIHKTNYANDTDVYETYFGLLREISN